MALTVEEEICFEALNDPELQTDDSYRPDSIEDTHVYRQKGSWSVYCYYFWNAGYVLLVIFLCLTVIEAFCNNFGSKYFPAVV